MNMPETGFVLAPVGSRTRCLSDVLQTFPLTHGLFAANHYGVGVVDDPVADDIGQKRV